MSKRRNDLVLATNHEIKVRLHAAKVEEWSYIHIDWLRFTINRRHAPIPSVELLFPESDGAIDYQAARDGWSQHQIDAAHGEVRARRQRVVNLLRDLPDPDYHASSQAFTLAEEVAEILGKDFTADTLIQKGKDFYRFRIDILRKGHPVGWVGFLASGNGKRKDNQNNTLHVNLEGMACTFSQRGWNDVMANYIEDHRGVITRIDLAADLMDGMDDKGHGDVFQRLFWEYENGLMDHLGHRPDDNLGGDHLSKKKGRSFYLGSRAAGKLTNIYEKGKELFGKEDDSKWIRVELRYGNQKRLLPVDMLRRPADFFAGASEWHASILRELGAQAVPEPVKCEKRVQVQTVAAEVTRNVRWFMNTAGASAVLALKNLPIKLLDSLCDEYAAKLPNRLKKFSLAEIEREYQNVFTKLASGGRASPSFA